MTKIYPDPCSLSNPEFYSAKHVDLNWKIDFERKVIAGKCAVTMELGENNGQNIVTLLTFN